MAKNKGGAQRKTMPETVSAAVDDLIQQYQDTGDVKYLTDFSVMEKLGISSRTLDRFYDGEADKSLLEADNISDSDKEIYKKHGYGEAIKRLIMFRRSECIQHIATGKASQSITGWIFLSKQPRWGGFQDVQRTETKQSGTFTVCIAGPDGRPLKE